MSLFGDLFSGFSNKTAENAAAKANMGLTQGYGALSDFYGQGRNALTTNYGKADDIWSNTMTNYDNLFKGGADAYGDVSGAHGVEGLQRGTDLWKNSGEYGVYGAANKEAQQALLRARAAGGMGLSGNADIDAMTKAADLATKSFGTFQQGLRPYLDNYGSAIGNVATGRANNAMALGNALNTSFTGQGGAANQMYTGVGKNDAGAELNKYNVSANIMNALKGAGSAVASLGGAGSLTSGLSGLFSGFGGSGSSISGGGGGYDPNTNMALYSSDGQRPLYA